MKNNNSEHIVVVSGHSSPTGFILTVKSLPPEHSEKKTFSTLHLEPEKSRPSSFLSTLLILSLAMIFTLLTVLFIKEILGIQEIQGWLQNITFFIMVISSGICGLVFGTFLETIYERAKGSLQWKWHGAEHKSAHLIEHGLEATKANFLRMPKEHPRCGTHIMLLIFAAAYMFWWINIPLLNFNGLSLLLALIGISTGLVLVAGNAHLSRLVQKFINTQEPTAEQTEEAIALIEQVYQEYNCIPEKE